MGENLALRVSALLRIFRKSVFRHGATMLFQHTEESGPPYENLGTVRQKMRQKILIPSLVFEFLSKNRMSFQQTEGAPNEYFGISRQKN